MPAWLKWGAVALLCAAVALSGWKAADMSWEKKWALRDKQDATAQRDAAIEQTETLKRGQAAMNEIRSQYQTSLKESEDEKNDIITKYRANQLRLKKSLSCAVQSVSDPARTGPASDAAGQCGLSGADVEFLVQFADRADKTAKQLTAAQATISKYYLLINKKELPR